MDINLCKITNKKFTNPNKLEINLHSREAQKGTVWYGIYRQEDMPFH